MPTHCLFLQLEINFLSLSLSFRLSPSLPGGVSRDPSSSSRPQKGHGTEMKRTSSAGHVLDYDEQPVKDSTEMDEYVYSYSRAKSHVRDVMLTIFGARVPGV